MSLSRASLFAILFLVLMVGASTRAPASDAVEQEALEVAETWLELVDQGEYDESWERAAAYLRTAVGRDQWRQTMTGFRQPLGEVVSRKLLAATYRSRLAGAPDGEYVVIRFNTSFSNKADAQETVTPMLDPDGQWRVSGYYFK